MMSNRPEWWLKVTRRFHHPDFIIGWLAPVKPIVMAADRLFFSSGDLS